MSPPTQNGPGGAPTPTRAEKEPATTKRQVSPASVQPRTDNGTIFPAAIGRSHAPSGRRRLRVSVVERCPYCGGDHVHRGTETAPVKGLRPAGCTRRAYYVVPQIKKAGSR